MAYTPINWQTGDTITAAGLNKMDNGWGIQSSEISETIETDGSSEPGAVAEGVFEYYGPIASSTLAVSFNGTSYVLPGAAFDGGYAYGDCDPDEFTFDFTTYPLAIISYSEGDNYLYTETSGTYSISVSVPTLEVGDSFKDAAQTACNGVYAGTDAYPLVMEVGTTTFSDVWNAIQSGRAVLFRKYSSGTSTYFYGIVMMATFSSPCKVYVLNAYDTGLSVYLDEYQASSADGILSKV